jgi:hypothetical protein
MTKPADCVVLIALPTSRSGFEWSRAQAQSEYANRFLLGWDQYEGVSDDLTDAVERYKSQGVKHVAVDARQEEWLRTLSEAEVVIIFAHWIESAAGAGAIEFWDGPCSVEELVDQIPVDFNGVIDLSVCHPFGFADQVARHRPNCSVCYAEYAVSPSIWAEIYCSIFEVLRRTGMDYREAVTRVTLEYRRQAKKKMKDKTRDRRHQ